MKKISYQHDFYYTFGDEVGPILAKDVMDKIYKLEEFKEKALPILENVQYWETCPDDYKCALSELLEDNK